MRRRPNPATTCKGTCDDEKEEEEDDDDRTAQTANPVGSHRTQASSVARCSKNWPNDDDDCDDDQVKTLAGEAKKVPRCRMTTQMCPARAMVWGPLEFHQEHRL
mmetsp:Transcript_25700/g.70844  ORF Transcript_25700/g.70844 Transcript_25700/m.70844 type:complete len:104 (-) Transcript_25700:283-594(-)